MTKIVNCWNEWDPLKRVIVGRPEGTQVPAPEPAWWHNYPKFDFPLGTYGKFPQEMVDEANEQMENFVKTMEKRGIIVDRVEVHPALEEVQAFSTPDWTQLNARGNCLSAFDPFRVVVSDFGVSLRVLEDIVKIIISKPYRADAHSRAISPTMVRLTVV